MPDEQKSHSAEIPHPTGATIPVILATTVMLTFISFWRAAAIVLCDLGSSAFYVGGISEQAIGKAAPWLILGVMCFSYAIRAVYIEACVMFVRGGVYRVVKSALGDTLAKLSVSALMFDYILTGPISGVSAGQYLVGVINEILNTQGITWTIPEGWGSALIAIAVTLYFWRKNIIGIHESSDKALRIMQITTVMVVIMILWSLWTIARRRAALPPLPRLENLRFSEDGVLSSWFRRPHDRYGTSYRIVNMIAILQIGTIAVSRGQVYLLGEAYAFGLIWSFIFNTLSMFVLRFKSPGPREWRVPFNIRLGCIRMYMGGSEKIAVAPQARLIGKTWEQVDDPDKVQFELVVVPETGSPQRFQIGAHAPELNPEDIELTHRLWLEIVEKVPEADFHHRDVLSLALQRFTDEFHGPTKSHILESIRKAAAQAGGRKKPRRSGR